MNKINKIAIASDHGGYELKNEIINYLKEKLCIYKDFGCYDSKPVNYPDYALKVGKAIVNNEYQFGILICGTGIGMSIAANKIKGIRASLCHDTFSARMAKEHNNANILTMGGRVMGKGLAREIVKVWLMTEFSQESRHIVRLQKVEDIYEQI
ncbi:MAG: ribose 5-phosphate isomerase B [Atribacterota bacterium]|nr:ribose 5-phosphate isomerase B [Atribacterota bacterium]MDD4895510.1 ribose 5-phosphate isomerase B [Atribacterota bacterium]MDD5636330.1 ribose 5-phosphate isomerase B [Atribacterota bacterium]